MGQGQHRKVRGRACRWRRPVAHWQRPRSRPVPAFCGGLSPLVAYPPAPRLAAFFEMRNVTHCGGGTAQQAWLSAAQRVHRL